MHAKGHQKDFYSYIRFYLIWPKIRVWSKLNIYREIKQAVMAVAYSTVNSYTPLFRVTIELE